MSITLSDGLAVHLTVMNAYPEGCLLSFDLGSAILPAVSSFPLDMVETFKQQFAGGDEAEGEMGQAMAAAAMERLKDLLLNPEKADGIFMGIAKALLQIADRARFERISGQLLATLTVEHNGQMVELVSKTAIQKVVGTNLKRCLELLFVALRGNMTAFFSGSGDTPDAPSSEPAPAPVRRKA